MHARQASVFLGKGGAMRCTPGQQINVARFSKEDIELHKHPNPGGMQLSKNDTGPSFS